MSFALLAFVFAVFAALSHASAPLNNLVNRQAETTSHPPVSGCQPECSAYVWESHWMWMKMSITATVTHATILYIVNDEGQTRTSTIFNELPEGVTPPPTNAAGTQTAAATVETELGKYTTVTLAYPTELDAPAPTYDWRGVLPTVNAMNQFTCSTREGLASDPGVELIGYTATITTEGSTLTGTKTRDPGGLLYTLASYACQVGAKLQSVPPGNSDDGAIQYCATNWANCPVGAAETVQFLTETSTTRERSTSSPPQSSSPPASSAEPISGPSTTTSPGALPIQQPDADSAPAATSTSRPANPRPISTPVNAPDDEGSDEPPQGETFPPAVSTTTMVKTSTGADGTSIVMVATEVTVPAITAQTPVATKSHSHVVVVSEPSANENVSSGPSTRPIGDEIAGGLGISGSGSGIGSSSSSSSATAQSFPGHASQYSIPSSLLVAVLAAIAGGCFLVRLP